MKKLLIICPTLWHMDNARNAFHELLSPEYNIDYVRFGINLRGHRYHRILVFRTEVYREQANIQQRAEHFTWMSELSNYLAENDEGIHIL